YALFVDQEEVVVAGTAGNIDIFPELNIALGAQDRQTTITPCGQAIRGEPVNPDITRRGGGAHMRVAHILQSGPVSMATIGDIGRNHFAVHGAGEEQELFELMAGNIAKDAAIALAREEPFGTV